MSTGMLLSYHYYRNHKDINTLCAEKLEGFPLFCDSGAYSARTQGAEILLPDYAAFLKQHGHLFTVRANLDLIGDPEGSWRNWKELNKTAGPQGQVAGVVHAGTPYSWIEKYIEAGETYILIGGMVGGPAAVRKWLTGAFRVIEGTQVGFHGFGRTNVSDLADFPWHSCDSSSWGSAYRFGTVRLWDRGGWVSIRVCTKDAYKHGRLLRAHGVEPRYLAERTLYHNRYAAAASAAAWHRMGGWWHERHTPVPAGARPAGPHLYLADGSDRHLVTAAAVIRKVEGL